MDWHYVEDKPLSEPLMTKFYSDLALQSLNKMADILQMFLNASS